MFNSIQEIKKEFNIKEDNTDKIRKILINKLAKTHPDKNKGEFISKESQNIYYKLNEAIEFMDMQKETGLMNVDQITDLVKTIYTLVNKKNEDQKYIKDLDQKIIEKNKLITKKSFLPKIGLSSITAVISFLWLFPKQISEHPILGGLVKINDFLFTTVWLIVLFVTVMAEGYGRNSTQDYVRFLRIASGSLYELQTLLEISRNLCFINANDFTLLYESSREVERMLSSLIKKVAP